MEKEESPNKKIRKNLRSWLWDHFEDLAEQKAKCMICSFLVDHSKGTNSMKHHLQSQHNITDKNKKPKLENECKDTQIINSKL